MPISFTYGLYPWVWNPPIVDPSNPLRVLAGEHVPPTDAACVLDFRPRAERIKRGQSGGYGLFAWQSGAPADLISLGTGYAPELLIQSAARNELKLKLGLSGLPAGNTLAECLADVLGPLSDPTDTTGPKPIMPTSGGLLELHLEAHSRVWQSVFDPSEFLGPNPKGHHNRIRDVFRADLAKIEVEHGGPIAQKFLGAMLRTCGYSKAELSGGAKNKASEWQRLLPPGWAKGKKDAFQPQPPTTRRDESWPNTASNIQTTSQDLSWTNLASTFSVLAATARGVQDFGVSMASCASGVASADHKCSVAMTIGGQPGIGGSVARASPSAATGYIYAYATTSQARRLYKVEAGTRSQLTTNFLVAWVPTTAILCYPNGSTITGIISGESDATTTDTSITGNLRGGIYIDDDTNNHTFNFFGPWYVDDLLPDAPVAAFSATPLAGDTSTVFSFTDSSSNTPTGWTWYYTTDGGSTWIQFSTLQNPSATFPAGTIGIKMNASNAGGNDDEIKLAYLTVTAPAAGNSAHRRAFFGIGR